ncbi:MAG: hypothetical protein AAGB05_08045 [Pseudomonadota bacterium]
MSVLSEIAPGTSLACIVLANARDAVWPEALRSVILPTADRARMTPGTVTIHAVSLKKKVRSATALYVSDAGAANTCLSPPRTRARDVPDALAKLACVSLPETVAEVVPAAVTVPGSRSVPVAAPEDVPAALAELTFVRDPLAVTVLAPAAAAVPASGFPGSSEGTRHRRLMPRAPTQPAGDATGPASPPEILPVVTPSSSPETHGWADVSEADHPQVSMLP